MKGLGCWRMIYQSMPSAPYLPGRVAPSVTPFLVVDLPFQLLVQPLDVFFVRFLCLRSYRQIE